MTKTTTTWSAFVARAELAERVPRATVTSPLSDDTKASPHQSVTNNHILPSIHRKASNVPSCVVQSRRTTPRARVAIAAHLRSRVRDMPATATTREDGRADEHCRPMSLALDVVSASSGSAYVELGDTKVSCAVYGPRRPRGDDAGVERGTIVVNVFSVPFARAQTGANGDVGAKRLENVSKLAADVELATRTLEALEASVLVESFPRAQVDVYVTILDAAGGEAVACVVAASAALARAGVEQRDLTSACECVRIGKRLVLDPTEAEVESSDGKVFLAQMSSIGSVSKSEMFGRWEADESRRALEACASGCNRFDAVMREVLRGAKW